MQLEHTIAKIEGLYTQITGQEAPKIGKQSYAPILPEKDPVRQVEAKLEQLLQILSQTPLTTLARPQWQPATCVLETESEILVKTDLPGVTKDEVTVKVENGRIVIKGTRTEKDAGLQCTVRMMETPTGRFERHIEVPIALSSDTKCQHQLVDGVLTVTVPKKKMK